MNVESVEPCFFFELVICHYADAVHRRLPRELFGVRRRQGIGSLAHDGLFRREFRPIELAIPKCLFDYWEVPKQAPKFFMVFLWSFIGHEK